MAECIYCRRCEPDVTFVKKEHVIPESFGMFRENLTLHDVVCDDCNQFFGDNLELHFGRATIDGFNRYRLGIRDARLFKTLRRQSTLIFRVDSGLLKGALASVKSIDGKLAVNPLPQCGFGPTPEGPFEWFLADELPDKVELRRLLGEGKRYVHACEFHDRDAAVEALRAQGAVVDWLGEVRPAGSQSTERIEITNRMGATFGRCIAKIAFNYFVERHGPAIARMPQFDTIRRYIRYGEPVGESVWVADRMPDVVQKGPALLGHYVTVGWDHERRTVMAQLSFHMATRYRVRLSFGDFLLKADFASGHFFDLRSMTAFRLKTSGRPSELLLNPLPS